MKDRLIVLSDMWGILHSSWINTYISFLEPHYNIQFYDSCILANLNLSVPDEEQIHEQFIKGGTDSAAELLINYEVETVDVLAFSVGGTIAWKAGLNGLKIRNLYLVSATRIRYEVEKPDCNISLYYGEFENFKPSQFWFESMNLNYISIKDGGHNIYFNAGTALEICSHITDRLFKNSAKTV